MRNQSFNIDTAPDGALVSIKSAGELAEISRATIYRLNKAGRLPFSKIGKLTRIKVGDLRRLIGAAT